MSNSPDPSSWLRWWSLPSGRELETARGSTSAMLRIDIILDGARSLTVNTGDTRTEAVAIAGMRGKLPRCRVAPSRDLDPTILCYVISSGITTTTSISLSTICTPPGHARHIYNHHPDQGDQVCHPSSSCSLKVAPANAQHRSERLKTPRHMYVEHSRPRYHIVVGHHSWSSGPFSCLIGW